jgi:hypothetical protein
VSDGDARSAQVALLGALRQLAALRSTELPLEGLASYEAPDIRNTRQERTGSLRAVGELRFHGPGGTHSVPHRH